MREARGPAYNVTAGRSDCGLDLAFEAESVRAGDLDAGAELDGVQRELDGSGVPRIATPAVKIQADHF